MLPQSWVILGHHLDPKYRTWPHDAERDLWPAVAELKASVIRFAERLRLSDPATTMPVESPSQAAACGAMPWLFTPKESGIPNVAGQLELYLVSLHLPAGVSGPDW